MGAIYESEIEQLAVEELQQLGYTYVYGQTISPEEDIENRPSYSCVIQEKKLYNKLVEINKNIPTDTLKDVVKKLTSFNGDFRSINEVFHNYLVKGIQVEYRSGDRQKGDVVYLLDTNNILNNDFEVVNQFTIIEKGINKRPDIIIYINGLPLIIFELKNPVDVNATMGKAYDQIMTYESTIPQLFYYNEICIISDGLEANMGAFSSPISRFTHWKIKDTKTNFRDELSILIEGLFNKQILIDYLRNFITYEKDKIIDENNKIKKIITVKKIAAYHQYYAVNKAIEKTISASKGDGKAGVVWHTQGSGKSLTMVFYTSKLIHDINMKNPTVLILNDRNDLDNQLFETFASNINLLETTPVQADSSTDLIDLLKVESGGIVFSTIQKFSPEEGNKFELLSNRKNIVVISDEAHRTQYGFEAKLRNIKDNKNNLIGKQIAYGFAKYLRDALPNATYLGFTGTPIELADKNTRAVFGDYIDIYDISQAIEDKVTVKIFYESRVAKLSLSEEGKNLISQFDTSLESTDNNEIDSSADIAKQKWTELSNIMGNPKILKNIAEDIVEHFENRQSIFEGKGMIVAMSREIAVNLYDEIIKIRPEWHDDDLTKGVIKVVMTSSSSDGPRIQTHHTTKVQRKMLAERMKDINDPLKLVIVRDMWLTGFDAPCLHTMYINKPMKGHALMQAIARVNRVFLDKPGGLIVDYIGIGNSLKEALNTYTTNGGKGSPTESQDRAFDILIEKIITVRQILYNYDYKKFFNADIKDKLSILLETEDYLLGIEKGKQRFIREVTLLSQAYALCKTDSRTEQYTKEIAFFQGVKARLIKFETNVDRKTKNYDSVIKNIVEASIQTENISDIFDASGIQKPEISILSNEFLNQIKELQYKNIASDLLQKLLKNEIKIRSKYNIAKSKTLMEKLNSTIIKFNNNQLTTVEIITELIDLAKEIKSSDDRQKKLNLSNDELAFYDALSLNDSAKDVIGDKQLLLISKEITKKLRANATIDYTIKESSRAKLMVIVKRTLNKYGYPPDKQEKAVNVIMQQAKNFADKWTME